MPQVSSRLPDLGVRSPSYENTIKFCCQLSHLFISMLLAHPKCGAISFTQISSNVFYFVIKRAKGIYRQALVKLAPALAPYLCQRSSFPEIKSAEEKSAYMLTT